MTSRTIGKYRILEKLGQGGMGAVFKAVDESLGREVAVKVMNPDLSETEVMKRFQAETRTLAALNQPEIATIHEIYRADSQVLVVMEYVRGETLDAVLKRSGVLPPERAGYLVAQILGALGHAHRAGIFHRDLKPSNVMVTELGGIKILDFGTALVSGVERMTSVGFMGDTPAYMAPERILGHEVDGRADVYSVGVLFYRLTTGHLPYQAESPTDMVQKQLTEPPTPARVHRPDLPQWCETVLAGALAKDPAQRFQTVDAFRSAVMDAIASSAAQTGVFAAPTMALPVADEAPPTMALPVSAEEPPTIVLQAVDEEPPTIVLPVVDEVPPTMMAPAPLPLTATMAAIPQVESTDVMPYITPSGVARSPVTPTATQAITTAVAVPPTVSQASGGTRTTLVVPRKQFALAGFVLAALVLVVLVLAVVVLRRSASPPATPPTSQTETADSTAAPGADAVPPPTAPPTQPSEPPVQTAPAATAPRPPAVVTPMPPPLPAAEVGDSKRSSAVVPAPTPASPSRPAPTNTTPFKFDAKAVVADGDKRRERDASVLIADGSVTVSQKNDAALYAVPIDAIVAITLSNSKQPLWNSPNGPAEAMKVEGGAFGFLKGGRNWLGLQTSDSLLVLRVDDDIVGRVVAGIQERTGLTVARLAEPKE